MLTETWLPVGQQLGYEIEDFSANFNNVGRGKGIAGYARDLFSPKEKITEESFQISKFSHSQVDVICIYRSKSNNLDQLIEEIRNICNMRKIVVIIGDVNLCYLTNKNNYLTSQLGNMGFSQIVNVPTHELGGCLDHVYIHKPIQSDIDFLIETSSPYYSDHDTIFLNINIRPEGISTNRKKHATTTAESNRSKKKIWKGVNNT